MSRYYFAPGVIQSHTRASLPQRALRGLLRRLAILREVR